MWLPYLERIGRPFLVLLREPEFLAPIAAATSAPVVYCPTLKAIDEALVPSLKVAFYVNHGAKNAHCIRFTQLTHIQIHHGDSDKAPSANPVSAIFDKNFVAGQAAIALELADRRRDTERLSLLEDRDRIAKDLHDTVIQRLFATAMGLMAAIKITQKREVAVRVQRAVDDLDETIRQIRSSIFALQGPDEEETLRSRLHELVDAATEHLGFAPSVRLDGLCGLCGPDQAGCSSRLRSGRSRSRSACRRSSAISHFSGVS